MSPAREVDLAPRVLAWARQRADLSPDELGQKLGIRVDRIDEWEQTGRLKLSVAEKLARVTHTPLGFLFLQSPPEERLALPDLRAIGDEAPTVPSIELLDVVNEAEARASWYRDYLVARGVGPLDFVGSLQESTPVPEAAQRIRDRLGLELEARLTAANWESALAADITAVEDVGILVTRSGIVGSNTHRPLRVEEFRGFAIADRIAPLIFLNGRDAKAAQMFTLMHELVHVWLGRSGVSNPSLTVQHPRGVERFSNAVAAELLVPTSALSDLMRPASRIDSATVTSLVRRFKVSSLVILRRLFDIRALQWDEFRALYVAEEARFRAADAARQPGGDFYRTQQTRSSRRLAAALIEDALEGRTPRRDAMRMLGIRTIATFNEMARRLGIAV
jgi:Zn-dependent peptidase ImmA (M78 family)/transcriptional regulator with XRE-family HTH domain